MIWLVGVIILAMFGIVWTVHLHYVGILSSADGHIAALRRRVELAESNAAAAEHEKNVAEAELAASGGESKQPPKHNPLEPGNQLLVGLNNDMTRVGFTLTFATGPLRVTNVDFAPDHARRIAAALIANADVCDGKASQ